MACFIVSAVEAAVVTVAEKVEEKKELSIEESKTSDSNVSETKSVKVPLGRKLKWLSNMLWGGSVLLLFEHIWHGEIVAWFPFLTAMSDPADTAEMLHEMATVGVSMAVLITLVWIGICVAADSIMKRSEENDSSVETV
ncbi:MAG: hypothetical protein J5684_08060 [Eubacterium sp.]|nr:hypothetical protein [Eubacterium sp.]